MKSSLILAAVLATVGSAAMAQGTVTLYGRINLSLERQKLSSGVTDNKVQNNSSRFGLRGSEDLGGGMKAGFQLESGVNPANGTASTPFWARQSEVNLGGNFGMVRLGNFTSEAYYATADYVSMHNHDTGTSSDAFYAYLGRNRSKVSYRLPAFGGSTFEAAVTLRDAPGDVDRTVDLAYNYDAGAMHLGAGYEKNGSANQFALRGLYEMGAVTLGGYYQRDKNGYASGNRNTFRLAGMYTMGATELHANFGHAGAYSNVANSSANQYTFGVNHNLSKRTKVYGFYTKVADKGTIYGDFSSIAVGVRHNF